MCVDCRRSLAMPAALMCSGVSKSGSPISMCTTRRPRFELARAGKNLKCGFTSETIDCFAKQTGMIRSKSCHAAGFSGSKYPAFGRGRRANFDRRACNATTEPAACEMGGGMLDVDTALEKQALEAGGRTTLRVRVQNHGDDMAEDARVHVRAPQTLALVSLSPYVRPGTHRDVLEFAIPSLLPAETCELATEVYALEAGDGEIRARLECASMSRETSARCVVHADASFAPEANRLELFQTEADAGAIVQGRAIVTNTGRADATIVALNAQGDLLDVTFDLPTPFVLERGMRRVIAVRGRIPTTATGGARHTVRALCASATGTFALGEAYVIARSRPRLEGSIEPCEYSDGPVACGERVGWCVYVTNAGGADADLTIALHASGGFYQPGTTRLDGANVIDPGGSSPLWSRDGIRIDGLRPGSDVNLEFSTVADSGSAMRVLARLVCDGRETLLESPVIPLDERAGTASFPFTVHDLVTRRNGQPALDLPPLGSSTMPAPRVCRSQSAAFELPAASYLASLDGLMRHLWALGALCADSSDDAAMEGHLGVTRIALRSVFDRLAIKLRMPHYPVRADDVLDPAADDALEACGIASGDSLGARLARAVEFVAADRDEYPELGAYRDALRSALTALSDEALVDALVVTQPALDIRLDAVVEHETGVRA